MVIDNKKDFDKCLKEIAMREEVKKNIAEASEEYSLSEYEWGLLDEEKDKRARYNAGITYARKEGIEQEKITIARNMLKEELSIDIIEKATGLSKEQIELIR